MRRFALALSAAVLTAPLVPLASSPASAVTCSSAAGFAFGTGTSSDPYLIETFAELQYLRDWTNSSGNPTTGKYFKQTADISGAGCTWTEPIGDGDQGSFSNSSFQGYYDGDGHVVSGLAIAVGNDGTFAGLFGRISLASGTAIQNLGFTGTVSITAGQPSCMAGGLVGAIYGGTVENSFAALTSPITTVSPCYAGGLVGYVGVTTSAMVSNSFSSTPMTGGFETGGLVGRLGASGQVTNSYANGALSGSPTADGGLVAHVVTGGSLTESFWDYETTGMPGAGNNLADSDGNFTGAAAYAKTTTEMQSLSTFTTDAPISTSWSIASGWDADYATTPWGICSNVNDGYPFLNVFYSSDPCSSTPAAAGGAVPDWPVFTFQTPGGGQCTDISPQHPRLNSWFTLPDADAPCFIKGSVITGWSIPGQDWAFAPGRRVWVVDSQTFTSVLEYEWVTIEYDSNVDAKDACLADGVDLPVADRTGITHIPRGVITDQPLWDAPVCSAPAYEFLGWTTDNPYDDPTILPKDGTMPAPAVNSDGDAANTIHLYAIWKYAG